MINPLRVEWSTPDEARRAAAREQAERDARRDAHRLGMSQVEHDMLTCRPGEREAVLIRHYPDLGAEVHNFGAMIDVRYVSEQWGVRTFSRGGMDLGTTGSVPLKLCDAKWVALVVTEDGTREMDPRTLRVCGPVIPGDALCGRRDDNRMSA